MWTELDRTRLGPASGVPLACRTSGSPSRPGAAHRAGFRPRRSRCGIVAPSRRGSERVRRQVEGQRRRRLGSRASAQGPDRGFRRGASASALDPRVRSGVHASDRAQADRCPRERRTPFGGPRELIRKDGLVRDRERGRSGGGSGLRQMQVDGAAVCNGSPPHRPDHLTGAGSLRSTRLRHVWGDSPGEASLKRARAPADAEIYCGLIDSVKATA